MIYVRTLIVWSELDLTDKYTVVFCVHRSPIGNFKMLLHLLVQCLSSLANCERNIVLGADLNVNLNLATIETVKLQNLLQTQGSYT